MEHTEPRNVPADELATYQENWVRFTAFTKWGIISVCATLVLMALLFL